MMLPYRFQCGNARRMLMLGVEVIELVGGYAVYVGLGIATFYVAAYRTE